MMLKLMVWVQSWNALQPPFPVRNFNKLRVENGSGKTASMTFVKAKQRYFMKMFVKSAKMQYVILPDYDQASSAS